MIHNGCHKSHLPWLALDGIVPGIAWWLTLGCRFLQLVVKRISRWKKKSANHFINALHTRRLPQLPPRCDAAPTSRRLRFATLLHKAPYGRLHIIWLNGSAATTMTTTNGEQLCLFAVTRKEIGIGGSRHRQSLTVRGSNHQNEQATTTRKNNERVVVESAGLETTLCPSRESNNALLIYKHQLNKISIFDFMRFA